MNTMHKLRKEAGERLFRLVIQDTYIYYNMPASTLDAIIRSPGLKKNTFKRRRELVSEIRKLRKEGINARERRRAGDWRTRFHIRRGNPVILPDGTPKDRLPAYRSAKWRNSTAPLRQDVEYALSATRYDTRTIDGADSFTDVTGEAWAEKGDAYSRSCTFRKTYANYRIKIPADWRRTVHDIGLTKIHGLITLAALPVETDNEGEEIWRAKWLRKSAGFSFKCEDGFIVRRDGEITHGSTIAAARSNLTRRDNQKRLDQHETEVRRKLEHMQLNGYAIIPVTLGDSKRAGNCEAGTLAFRDRHFPGQDSAPVKDVLEAAERTNEKRFAIAAAWQAIRRTNHVTA